MSYFLYRSVISNLDNLLTWRQLFRVMFCPFSIQIQFKLNWEWVKYRPKQLSSGKKVGGYWSIKKIWKPRNLAYTIKRSQTKHHQTILHIQNYKQSPNNTPKDQIHYKSHKPFDTITTPTSLYPINREPKN